MAYCDFEILEEFVHNILVRCTVCKRELHVRNIGVKRTCIGSEIVLPPMAEQVVSYAVSTAKLAVAGFPSRTPEEIEHIFTTICQPCEFYLEDKGVPKCGKCGCHISAIPELKTNKLSRATEHCPAGKW